MPVQFSRKLETQGKFQVMCMNKLHTKKRLVIMYMDLSLWQIFVVCNLGKARQIILKF